MRPPIRIYSTERYRALRDVMLEAGGFEAGEVERRTFPDGEHYRRLIGDADGRDVVLLGGTVDEADTLEIYDLAYALVHQGAHTLTLMIPWYGYQTMERMERPGEVVVAKTRAHLLSSIPLAGSGNRVVLMDLHSHGITEYFSGSMRPVHLSARPLVIEELGRLGGERFVLGATDAGRAKWVEELANELGVDAAFVFKRRLSGAKTEVQALAADVRERRVVIYDDMIRTGGSLLGAARAFLDAGATQVAAVCTHGVFPADALERLRASGLLTEIVCTDTHARVASLDAPGFLRVRSVAGLLTDFLRGAS
ncbi:MAG: ribose-phosphate diphosphokinase [Myxococcales bacterium]|nr:ribose-phosphate diphosphokinase [Myxococcales bacterium]